MIVIKKRDYIYYDYILMNVKPKGMWKLYCFLRKKITLFESPSKINWFLFHEKPYQKKENK